MLRAESKRTRSSLSWLEEIDDELSARIATKNKGSTASSSGVGQKTAKELYHELSQHRKEQQDEETKKPDFFASSDSQQARLDAVFDESALYNQYRSALTREWFDDWFRCIQVEKQVVPMFFGGLGIRHNGDRETELAQAFWSRIRSLVEEETAELQQSIASSSTNKAAVSFDEWGYLSSRASTNKHDDDDSGSDRGAGGQSRDSQESNSSSDSFDGLPFATSAAASGAKMSSESSEDKNTRTRQRIQYLKGIRDFAQSALDEPLEVERNYRSSGFLRELETLVHYLRIKWKMPRLCIVPGTLTVTRLERTRNVRRCTDVQLERMGTVLSSVICEPMRDWTAFLSAASGASGGSENMMPKNQALGLVLQELDRRLLLHGSKLLEMHLKETAMDEKDDDDEKEGSKPDEMAPDAACGYDGPWPILLCFESPAAA